MHPAADARAPMNMANMKSPEAYTDVFERLEREGVRYVVVSGVAVVLRGRVRPVFDLDIVVDPAPDESARALRALLGAGFVPSIPLPLSVVSVMRTFDNAGREVDLFTRYHIPFEALWADAEHVPVGGGVARVVSLEHLLRAKRINGRPHDLEDIAGLLALEAGGMGKEPA
jgi:hypothetical protein